MDGSKTVTLMLPAENEIQVWLGHETPGLVVRCQEQKAEVYVVTNTAASVESGTDAHTVRLRFDQDKAITQHWSASTDDKALFAPNGKQTALQVSKASILAFQFTPFNASPAVVRFNLKGITTHIGELREACKWTSDN